MIYTVNASPNLPTPRSLISTGKIENRNANMHRAEFYAPDGGGWSDEPLSQALQVSGQVISEIFPRPEDALSWTALDNGSPIGQAHHNRWDLFLSELPIRLTSFQTDRRAGTRKFASILSQTLAAEGRLKALLERAGFPIDKIVHNCGIMMLRPYRGRGLATDLLTQALEQLQKRGFKIVVIETTHRGSTRISEKLGFVPFHSFDYKADFGINLDDHYEISYKTL